MKPPDVVQAIEARLEERFKEEATGHDWHHISRVRRIALKIAGEEGPVDLFVVELGALLHDVADWKFNEGDTSKGPELTSEWLFEAGVESETVQHVSEIVAEVSFKGAGVRSSPSSLEGKIVQDADRLDALGAIGIARAFAYGGAIGSPIHDPQLKPVLHRSFDQYRKHRGTTVNHFHEKLLLLKDRLHTATARALAVERHQFMERFLEQFLREWGDTS